MRRWYLSLLVIPLLTAGEWRDVEFAKPAGISLTLDALTPESAKPQPAVILVHGGGWEAGDKRTYIRPWFSTLTGARIAWFSINYRLSGQAAHPAAVEDIEAAVRFVQANSKLYGVDPNRLALMGESAGGHLVALVAVREKVRIRTAISFYGIHDIPLWVKQRGELPKNIAKYLGKSDPAAASPITYVTRSTPPMLFIHGTGDKGVPFEQSNVMCDRMKKAGAACEVILIEGAPHGVENWAKFDTWKPRLLDWLSQRL